MSALAHLARGLKRLQHQPLALLPALFAQVTMGAMAMLWVALALRDAPSDHQHALTRWLMLAAAHPGTFLRVTLAVGALLLCHLFVGAMARAASYGTLNTTTWLEGLRCWGRSLCALEFGLWLTRTLLVALGVLVFFWIESTSRSWIDERWRLAVLALLGALWLLLWCLIALCGRYAEVLIIHGEHGTGQAVRETFRLLKGDLAKYLAVWLIPVVATLLLAIPGLLLALSAPKASSVLALARIPVSLWLMASCLEAVGNRFETPPE